MLRAGPPTFLDVGCGGDLPPPHPAEVPPQHGDGLLRGGVVRECDLGVARPLLRTQSVGVAARDEQCDVGALGGVDHPADDGRVVPRVDVETVVGARRHHGHAVHAAGGEPQGVVVAHGGVERDGPQYLASLAEDGLVLAQQRGRSGRRHRCRGDRVLLAVQHFDEGLDGGLGRGEEGTKSHGELHFLGRVTLLLNYTLNK